MTMTISDLRLSFILKGSLSAQSGNQSFTITTEIHNNKLYRVSLQGSGSSTMYFYAEEDLKELIEAFLTIAKVIGIEPKEKKDLKKKLDEVLEQGRLVDLK